MATQSGVPSLYNIFQWLMKMGFISRGAFGVRAIPDEKQQSFSAVLCGYCIYQESHSHWYSWDKFAALPRAPGYLSEWVISSWLSVSLRVWFCIKHLGATWGFAGSVPGFMDRSRFTFVGFLFVQACNQELIKASSVICQVSLSPQFLIMNEDQEAQFSQFSAFTSLCAQNSV